MGPKQVIGLLAIVVPLGSTLSGCLTYQFVHYISHIKRAQYIAGLIASLTLALDLLSMVFQIIVFRTFTQQALLDDGPIKIPSWQIISLIVVNFVTATISRVYFTRLASTMLRCPRIFLSASLFLFAVTMAGQIVEATFTGIENSTDPNEERTPVWKRYLLHLVLGSAKSIWDCLICGVLLYNLLDSNKRCRFGSVHGKASFGIVLVFESFLAATIIMMSSFVVLSAISVHSKMNRMDLDVTSAGTGTLATRLFGISTLCSLQHKMNEHSKLSLGQKLFSSTGPISNEDSDAVQVGSPLPPDPHRSPETESGPTRSTYSSRDSNIENGESGKKVCVENAKTKLYADSVASVIHVISNGIIESRHTNAESVTANENSECEVSLRI